MSKFFNAPVIALAKYEEKEEQFKEQVPELWQCFQDLVTPDALVGDWRGMVAAIRVPMLYASDLASDQGD